MIGWGKARTLKDYLLKAKITNKDAKESKSHRCNEERCQVCQYTEETCEFEDADGNKYHIYKGVIKCNTHFTVYRFHCSSCSKQYVESNITDFRYRFNKSAFRKVSKSGNQENQENFYRDFKIPEHNCMDAWRVALIDRTDNRKDIRRRGTF